MIIFQVDVSQICDNISMWTFKCYITENGRDVIAEWYEGLPIKAQAKFDWCISSFRDLPQHLWSKEHFEPLKGFEGIFELRFTINNIVYRPLGCFAPHRHDFTLLIGAREHGDRFEPKNAPKTALERRLIILESEERACECDF